MDKLKSAPDDPVVGVLDTAEVLLLDPSAENCLVPTFPVTEVITSYSSQQISTEGFLGHNRATYPRQAAGVPIITARLTGAMDYAESMSLLRKNTTLRCVARLGR